MKACILFVLLFSCNLTLAQTKPTSGLRQQSRPPQLHVIFVLEPKGVEYGRLNMENDTIMRRFVSTVQRGIGYPMQIRWLDEKHFTSKALQDTIAALKTTPKDLVILYYSGYGISSPRSAEKFANWRLADVKDKGLPVSEVEGWLKIKNVQLALLIADCSTELIKKEKRPVSALLNTTIDLTDAIIKQLFLRNRGIVRLGSAAPSSPAYINTADTTQPGTLFTYALDKAFSAILDNTDPITLPYLSFNTFQKSITDEMERTLSSIGLHQAAVLEVKTWAGTPVRQRKPVASAVSAGVRWQGLVADNLADAEYNLLVKKQRNLFKLGLPEQLDLSMYAPPVLKQGDKGNCVAISIGYYMYSIMDAVKLNLTDKNKIFKQSLSPYYLYSAVKKSNDHNCTFGIEVGRALGQFKQAGIPRFSDFPDPNFCTAPQGSVARRFRIQDYVKLFDILDPKQEKVRAVKQTLAESSPVVVGIQTTGSLQELSFTKTLLPRLKASVWELIESRSGSTTPGDKNRYKLDMSWKPYQANALAYGHALCIVGYDDNKMGKGQGAFKLINSWGSSWGEGGYFWMSYDTFGKFAKYGYQAYLTGGNELSARLEADLTLSIGAARYQPPFTRMSGNAGLVTYKLKNKLRTGTKFKFRIDTKKQTYLHIISANDSGGTVIMKLVGLPTLITPATRSYLPTNEYQTLEGRPGLEHMLFLFSDSSRDDEIKEYIQAMKDAQGPFPERVKQVFGSKLVANHQIHYKPKKMGFFLLGSSNQVRNLMVPLLISLRHVP